VTSPNKLVASLADTETEGKLPAKKPNQLNYNKQQMMRT